MGAGHFQLALSDTGGFIVVVCVICSLVVLYMLPSIVAAARDHRNIAAILVLNILLGWTLIGWAIAIVWAFMATERRERAQRDYD